MRNNLFKIINDAILSIILLYIKNIFINYFCFFLIGAPLCALWTPIRSLVHDTGNNRTVLTQFLYKVSHMIPEGTRVIAGSMNMGCDFYLTLPGLELATCSVTSKRQFL